MIRADTSLVLLLAHKFEGYSAPMIYADTLNRPPVFRRSLSLQFCTAVTTGAALYYLIW